MRGAVVRQAEVRKKYWSAKLGSLLNIRDEETLEAEKDACIDKNEEMNKTRISESCFRDPQFTDCALTEGDQVIGSGCTLKYKGKGPYESK